MSLLSFAFVVHVTPRSAPRHQLPVQGHANVESALREYVSDADLNGANQYQLPDSPEKEKADAVKRTRFKFSHQSSIRT